LVGAHLLSLYAPWVWIGFLDVGSISFLDINNPLFLLVSFVLHHSRWYFYKLPLSLYRSWTCVLFRATGTINSPLVAAATVRILLFCICMVLYFCLSFVLLQLHELTFFGVSMKVSLFMLCVCAFLIVIS
jgi:hypothetical protein